MSNPSPPSLPPVRPADPLLRLRGSESFSWKMFETFAEQVVLAFTGERPIHYGKQGEKQDGIDCYVDVTTANRWTFQFRQVENFSEADARKVVKETAFEGQRRFLFVACEVGTAVRDYFDALPEWEIWDVRNISLYVRTMPAEAGRRLVYQCFGNDCVKNLFDGSVIVGFVTAEIFFAPRGDSDLLRHDLPLVGRSAQVAELREFVASDAPVAVISGRGGIGKSRLLRDLPVLRGGSELRFATTADLTADSVGDLPLEPTIVVIDDVHQRDDLKIAIEIIRQRPIATKLVLVTRSHGVAELRSRLSRAGFSLAQICEITPLEELAIEETRTVIRSVIGQGREEAVSLLAHRVSDSPVLAVVAARLFEGRGLDLARLADDPDVRFTVFGGFRDELIGRATELEANVAREVITLVASLGPVRVDDPQVRAAMGAFLKLDDDQLVRAIDALKLAGILRQKGSRVRVTPEVLADFVLEEACLTSARKPTGYATRIFCEFKHVWGARLLRNFGEVDWRASTGKSEASKLLEAVWDEIAADLEAGSIVERSQLLNMVEEVACFQPAEALRIVERVLREPVGTVSELERAFKFSARNILRHLPPILKQIALNLDFVPRVARLLWEMGRDDGSPQNSSTDHPFRVLTELAGSERRKPIEYQQAVVRAAQLWLEEPGVHEHSQSLIDVFGAALARQGLDAWSENAGSFALKPYVVNAARAATMHEDVLDIVSGFLDSDRVEVVMRASKVLCEYARPMSSGTLGQVISDEQQEWWKARRLRALNEIANRLPTLSESCSRSRFSTASSGLHFMTMTLRSGRKLVRSSRRYWLVLTSRRRSS